jgi:hypothetical protein
MSFDTPLATAYLGTIIRQMERARQPARSMVPTSEVSVLELILRIIIALLIVIIVMPICGVVCGVLAVVSLGYKAMSYLCSA